jgi:hypothetical protein
MAQKKNLEKELGRKRKALSDAKKGFKESADGQNQDGYTYCS